MTSAEPVPEPEPHPIAPDLRLELGEDPDDTSSLEKVWVTSDVTPLGVYVSTIHYTDDISRTLSPHQVGPYADALMMAVMQCEYDAAVVNQLLNVRRDDDEPSLARDAAFEVIRTLRASRPSIDQKAVSPLIVRPSVGYRTGLPFLHLRLSGTQRTWAWNPANALEHAQYVRELSVVADLDAHYRRVLVSSIAVDDRIARAMVGDLAQWRLPRDTHA